MQTRISAFTLIELLIVVAIIGILAAIAVPNFMNARIRANVAHSKSEMRTYQMVQQLYLMDQTDLPGHFDGQKEHCPYIKLGYIGEPLTDPFVYDRNDRMQFSHEGMYHSTYVRNPETLLLQNVPVWDEWKRLGETTIIFGEGPAIAGSYASYDSSNGMRSHGRIIGLGSKGKSSYGDNLRKRECE